MLKKKWEYNIKIYTEIRVSESVTIIVDTANNNNLILAHYFKNKIIPFEYFNINHKKDIKKNIKKNNIKLNFF